MISKISFGTVAVALVLAAGVGAAAFGVASSFAGAETQGAAVAMGLVPTPAPAAVFKGCAFQSELGSWRVSVDGRTYQAQPLFQWDVPRALLDHQAYLYCAVESSSQQRGQVGFCRTDRNDPVCNAIKSQKPR